jgi:hypothetical protein
MPMIPCESNHMATIRPDKNKSSHFGSQQPLILIVCEIELLSRVHYDATNFPLE